MSWTDYYRRRDALDDVIRRAAVDPAGPLPRSDVFAGPDEILLALHYKWTLKLTGRLGMALADAERDPDVDLLDAVSEAYRATVADNPVLHAVLEAHAVAHPALWPSLEAELRTLALAAGLAEPHERPAEIARVGAAFKALVQSGSRRSGRGRNPVEQLLRRLAASA